MKLVPRDIIFRDLFDELFNMPALKTMETLKSDIYEKNGDYVIEMDIPGFKKEEINIEYDKGYLSITAKKEEREDSEEEEKNYIRKERYYGEYRRSFYVGEIDEEAVKANFENGILKIEIPKKQEEIPDRKKIEIK